MRHWLPATIFTLSLLSGQCSWLSADAAQPTQLQRAVNLIYKDPLAAEQQLRRLSSPTAKAYLAFLYMSHKVKTPDAGRKIDSLMHAAAGKVQDGAALGAMDPTKRYHYKDMGTFLSHLRFIGDADGYQAEIPEALFIQYPEGFDAFGPYWGSSRDGQLPIQYQARYDIKKIPAVAQFLATLNSMFGDPRSECSGTIRNLYYRKQFLSEQKAGLAPRFCEEEQKSHEVEIKQKQLDRFLNTWGNEELWNQQACRQLALRQKAAEAPLAAYYRRNFALSQRDSVSAARAAMAGIRLAYLGEYSPGGVDETRGTQVYQIYSTTNLTLKEMQRQLGASTLSSDELAQALRLAILNNAETSVIDWLIKAGAPVSGGKEPPLFSAVLRPEVVSILLKAGADANETNALGKTALIQAAQFNGGETIKVLLAAGADINHAMVQTNDEKAQETIQDCNYNYSVGGRTALMYAAAFSDSANIKLLLSKGASKKALDSAKKKPVQFLSWNYRLSKEEKKHLESLL